MSSNSTDTASALASLPHDDRAPVALGICWSLMVLSGFFMALRLYCKLGRHRLLWWDDYTLIAAWIFTCVALSVYTHLMRLGLGHHIWDIDPTLIEFIGFRGNIGAMFAILGTVLTKTSFGLTLIRLADLRMRWFITFLLVTTNIFMLFTALAIYIRCNPVEKSWNLLVPGTCSQALSVDVGIASAIYSGVMDIVLAFIPWAIIWKMKIRPREKAGIAIAMSIGILGGVAAFLKASKIHLLSGADFTYVLMDLIVWGHVEATVSIIAASIPMLRVLLRGSRPFADRQLSTVTHGGKSIPLSGDSGTTVDTNPAETRGRSEHSSTGPHHFSDPGHGFVSSSPEKDDAGVLRFGSDATIIV